MDSDLFSTTTEDSMRDNLRGTLRMEKDTSYIQTLHIITVTLKQVINKEKGFLFGTMEKCIGENGLKEKNTAQEHGKELRALKIHILANGSMVNPMGLVFLQIHKAMYMKDNSNFQ